MSKATEVHPIQIGFQFNEQMRAFDLAIFVGNFKTKADADAYAKRIMEFLESQADGEFQRVQ